MSSRGVPGTYQAVKATTKKVHSSHLHRGGSQGWAAHRGSEVQVEEVTQQVALGRDDIRLLARRRSRRGCLRALCALAPAQTQAEEGQQGGVGLSEGGLSPQCPGPAPRTCVSSLSQKGLSTCPLFLPLPPFIHVFGSPRDPDSRG